MASHGGPPCRLMASAPNSPGCHCQCSASREDESCAGQAEELGSANNLRLGQSGCCAHLLIALLVYLLGVSWTASKLKWRIMEAPTMESCPSPTMILNGMAF